MNPETMYRAIAGSGDYENFVQFLTLVQDEAADLRKPLKSGSKVDIEISDMYDVRQGAIAILTTMIDNLRIARHTLNQQSAPLETEND